MNLIADTLISDFSRVLLHFNDESYDGSLNGKHRELSSTPGYKILNYFHLNQDLLVFYKKLKDRGVHVVMYTSETIQDEPDLWPFLSTVFEKKDIFSAKNLEIDKKDASGYSKLANILKKDPRQIVFIDDATANIEAASSAHLRTVQFQSNDQAMRDLNEIFLTQ